ncbi:MAG TPA: hypothetical protein PK878_03540 [bacterium]|nr:hypothetical protein [bacterium]
MSRAVWAQALFAVFLAAWGVFACLDPAARAYTLESFSSGDAAFTFYDDFPVHSGKADLIYKILGIFVLGLLLRIHHQIRSNRFSRWIPWMFLAGGIAILLSWSTALMVFLLLFALVYPWDREHAADEQSRLILSGLVIVALILRVEQLPTSAGRDAICPALTTNDLVLRYGASRAVAGVDHLRAVVFRPCAR